MTGEKHQIIIDQTRCAGCRSCTKDCPAANIVMNNGKAKPLGNNCILCGHCQAVCPVGAISISDYGDKPIRVIETTRLNSESVIETLRFRRSIRRFKSDAVQNALIEKIIEAGRLTHGRQCGRLCEDNVPCAPVPATMTPQVGLVS